MQIITITNTLGVLILLLLVVLLIVGLTLGRKGSRDIFSVLRKNDLRGAEATAIVLFIEETGIMLNEHPQVRMQMQVIPEKGRNFVAEIKDVFSPVDLDGIKTGSTFKVKYNPSNPKDIILIRNN